jgi:hypothetical protein
MNGISKKKRKISRVREINIPPKKNTANIFVEATNRFIKLSCSYSKLD